MFRYMKMKVKRFYIQNLTKQVRLEVSYTAVDTEFIEIWDDRIISIVAPCEWTGSGYCFGTRDLSFVGSMWSVVRATKRLKKLQMSKPELQVSILNEIEDAEFMGTGY
jgi:hypothetical protein